MPKLLISSLKIVLYLIRELIIIPVVSIKEGGWYIKISLVIVGLLLLAFCIQSGQLIYLMGYLAGCWFGVASYEYSWHTYYQGGNAQYRARPPAIKAWLALLYRRKI